MGLQSPPESEGPRMYHNASRGAQTKQRLWRPKKLRPAPGEGLAARDPVWDGEGWECDRVACLRCLLLLVIAGAGGGDCGTAVAKRDPYIRIALRLTLDEAISSLGPGHDSLVLVVENELALVGFHGQHRVAFALLVAHHRDQQRLARPAGIDQHLALQQHVVLAVAEAVRRQRPFLDHAPMIHVGHRLDVFVDPAVDPQQVSPCRLRHHDIARLGGAAAAIAGIVGTEFDPADPRAGGIAQARKKSSFLTGTRRRADSHQDGDDRQPFPLSPEPKHCGPRFLLGPRFAQRIFAAAKYAKYN